MMALDQESYRGGGQLRLRKLSFAWGYKLCIWFETNCYLKEYIKIFGGGKAMVINNFKSGKALSLSQDKGHYGEFRAFTQAILHGKPSPISLEELALTTLVTFKIHKSLKRGVPICINAEEIGLTT